MLLGDAPRFFIFVPHFHRPGRVDYPCPRSSRRPYAHQPSFFGGGQLLVPSAAVQRDPAAQCGARYRASRRKREGLPESLKYVLPPCGLVASGWQAPTCAPPSTGEVLELREWPVFADLADAQASVANYIDYYNHDRLHSSIGYQMPYHAHQHLLQTTALNCPA